MFEDHAEDAAKAEDEDEVARLNVSVEPARCGRQTQRKGVRVLTNSVFLHPRLPNPVERRWFKKQAADSWCSRHAR